MYCTWIDVSCFNRSKHCWRGGIGDVDVLCLCFVNGCTCRFHTDRNLGDIYISQIKQILVGRLVVDEIRYMAARFRRLLALLNLFFDHGCNRTIAYKRSARKNPVGALHQMSDFVWLAPSRKLSPIEAIDAITGETLI